MIGLVRRTLDQIRGTGDASVTIPSMDGAFRPNSLLDAATVVTETDAPDNLVDLGGRILLSSGPTLLALTEGPAAHLSPVEQFESEISSLAAHSSGTLAIGFDQGGILLRGGVHNGKIFSKVADRTLSCVTAMAFTDAETLFLTLGSRTNAPSEWKRDLMERNASGSVWRLDLGTGRADCLADRLAYPLGLVPRADGSVVVCESWHHRLILTNGSGKPNTLLGDLPGYPARIAANAGGSFWLCLFAPRRQMVEFVLREPAFLAEMLRDVPEEFWMAPALSTGHSFEEPLQGGGVKHLGITKPWAPTRSYGLVVELSDGFLPVRSAHSRADGRRHGVMSALSIADRVLVASKGSGCVLALHHETLAEV